MEVKLHDLGGFSVGGVGDLDRDCDGPIGGDRGEIDGEVGGGELGGAEPVPEWEQRRAGLVPVAAALVLRFMGTGLGIDDRNLSDRARPAERQLAAGYGSAEQQVSHRGTALSAGIPDI